MLDRAQSIPILNTTLTEPFHFLECHFLAKQTMIQEWFINQWQQTVPPVYGSVDLRNAGYKLAPIDMNLFPAGFNNLNPEFLCLSVAAAKKSIHQLVPNAEKILIIPESHTRNLYYWENVKTLQTILEKAGFVVRLGKINEADQKTAQIELSSGNVLSLYSLIRSGNDLQLIDFHPDVVLLNNDLSEGIPDILQNLKQPLIPPAELGWSQRLKSAHFQYYAEVAEAFAAHIQMDPWLIMPLFRHCGCIDFMQQEGMDCLISHANTLFDEIKQKYAEYGISHQPFLIVKADAGTYGMAVMTIRNVYELTSLNRKQRTRMSSTKGGQPVHRVIIQEGVYSFETWGPNRAVAEPVIYLWGDHVVGGFYRVHENRGPDENLNTPGMQFKPLPFARTCTNPRPDVDPDACENRLYTYGIVAQLSMLAAAREMKDLSIL